MKHKDNEGLYDELPNLHRRFQVRCRRGGRPPPTANSSPNSRAMVNARSTNATVVGLPATSPPLLGRRSAASVTRDDVEHFMHDIATGKTASRQKNKPRGLSVVRGGRGVASRRVGLLGAIFTYAARKGIRFDNPAHGIVRFADGGRQRRLTNDEYRQLGRALKTAEVWKAAIAAIWLMILTGWRRGEALGLRRSEVDLPRRTASLAHSEWESAPRSYAGHRHSDRQEPFTPHSWLICVPYRAELVIATGSRVGVYIESDKGHSSDMRLRAFLGGVRERVGKFTAGACRKVPPLFAAVTGERIASRAVLSGDGVRPKPPNLRDTSRHFCNRAR